MSYTGFLSNTPSKGKKLGYYRASIACTSCRKRKARCTPSANDDDRCTNCVRYGRPCLAIAASAVSTSPGHSPVATSPGPATHPSCGRHDDQCAVADRSMGSTSRSRPRRKRDRRSSASSLHHVPPPVFDTPGVTGDMVPLDGSATLPGSPGMELTLQLGNDPEQNGFIQPPLFQFNGSNAFNSSVAPTAQSGPHNMCQYDTMITNMLADWSESDAIFDINSLLEPTINYPPYEATDIDRESDARQATDSGPESLASREFDISYPHQLCLDLRPE